MVIILIALWSLCAIYFTRLLTQRKMRAAAISVAVLYVYLIAWIYAIFILDIADLGFSDAETRLSLLHGSGIYHSFVQLNAKMSVIPLPLLKAIVGVAAMTLTASIIVAFHGIFEISREIYRIVKKKRIEAHHRTEWKITTYSAPVRRISIIRLYCRANC